MLNQIVDYTIKGIAPLPHTVIISLIVVACAYLYYRPKSSQTTQRLQPCPFINNQSRVVDKEQEIRTSPVDYESQLLKDLNTVRDIMRFSLKTNRDKMCFGRRKDFNTPATWTTFAQVDQNIRATGAALLQLFKSVKNDNRFVGIHGRNSPEWVYTLQACGYYGLVAVPLYETFGQEAMQHIMEQTEMRIVVCDTIERARKFMSWGREMVDHVIVMETKMSDLEQFRKEMSNNSPQLHDFCELLTMGKKQPVPPPEVNPEDMFLICYTSGSTGLPKGVIHSHSTFTHALKMSGGIIEHMNLSTTNQMHISLLPLSHIMEEIIMAIAMLYGISVGFLTTTVSGLGKDLAYYRPTIFCAVPRILSRYHTNVMNTVQHNRLKLALVNHAIKRKLDEQSSGIFKKSGLIDYFFFQNVRNQLGGRVEQIVCASAPLPAEVLEFTKAAFSCPIYEVYGSTEGCLISVTIPTSHEAGVAGSIVPCVKVKLADVPSMNIVAKKDKTGEICIQSKGCTKGYFKDEEKTKELFDNDGFLKTGDIGIWNKNGCLKIVDRCKSMFKLSQGEYVAPEKVEQVYSTCSLVRNIFLDGDSAHSFAVAIIVPDCKEIWLQFSHQLSKEFDENKMVIKNGLMIRPTDEALCNSSLVKKLVLDKLTQVGQSRGLKGFEQAKAIYLCSEPFHAVKGLVTPTLKVSRPNVRKHFAQTIESLYKTVSA